MCLMAFLCLMSSTAWAAKITFTWDANTETNLAGYRLYKSATSGSYQYGPTSPNFVSSIPDGTETYTMLNVAENQKSYFVLTAYNNNNQESGPSNEVFVDLTPPAAPKNFIHQLIVAFLNWLQGFKVNRG